MRIKPLTGQVLIEILPKEKRSAGGIEFPEHTPSAEEVQASHRNPTPPLPWQGIVREIGKWPVLKNGLANMPPFGIGQKVLVAHNAGIAMEQAIGKRFRMVKMSEVLAIISDTV